MKACLVRLRQRLLTALWLLLPLLWTGPGWAFGSDKPKTDQFGYKLYELVSSDIIAGPIGFIAGVFFLSLGASQLNKSPFGAVASVLAGGAVLWANTLVGSMGLL